MNFNLVLFWFGRVAISCLFLVEIVRYIFFPVFMVLTSNNPDSQLGIELHLWLSSLFNDYPPYLSLIFAGIVDMTAGRYLLDL